MWFGAEGHDGTCDVGLHNQIIDGAVFDSGNLRHIGTPSYAIRPNAIVIEMYRISYLARNERSSGVWGCTFRS